MKKGNIIKASLIRKISSTLVVLYAKSIGIFLITLAIVPPAQIYAQYETVNVVNIDANCVDSFASIVNQKSNQNWNDSLNPKRTYPAMNLIRNISLGINNFLVLQDMNSYTGNPYIYLVYYFGLVTDYNKDISISLSDQDKIPIVHSDLMRLADISSFNIGEFFNDSQLVQTLIKGYKIQQYLQYTDKKVSFPRENNLKEINKIRQLKFSKFRFTRIEFENVDRIIKYYKWERIINGCPRTIAIEIRISNLMN